MDFTSRRWMYPVSEVLQAVSMTPSRPPMACIQTSCGVSPARYEFSTKPRDSAPKSSLVKWGKVRSLKPYLILAPSTFCWPTHAIIWAMLIGDPLLPAFTMEIMLFLSSRELEPMLPASSRAAFSRWLTFASKDWYIVLPGCVSNLPRCASARIVRTSTLACFSVRSTLRSVSSLAIMSATPHENPLCVSHWHTIFCRNDRTLRQACGPESSQTRCSSEPLLAPIVFLQTMPESSSPFWMTTLQSLAEKSGSSFLFFEAIAESRFMERLSGSSLEKICLPVHISLGRRMHGVGSMPSHTGSHMRMFMARSFSMKLSRFVYLAVASRESCTMPMTGLLPCGDTTWRGLSIMYLISARVS
mmetsp:Transcript_74137/g.191237  ORF Transcript_74137/g.191237 Transcript_74137/m.191237 type:complete len:358 (+) Transcript_74137:2955-4028(+)